MAKIDLANYLESLPEERRAKIMEALVHERQRRRRFIVVFVAIFVLAGLLFVGLNIIAKRGRTLPANGIHAVAFIDQAQDGNCVIGEKYAHCYRLFLTVHQRALSPYAAQLDVNVADRWASRIQPGSLVSVVIDRTDNTKVYLDVAAFALPPPLLPSPSPATSTAPTTPTVPR